MLDKTLGIVLNQIKYGETSLILQLYTQQWGRMGLMVPGARGKSRKRKKQVFHPLSILELEVYYKSTRDLQNAKEIRNHSPFQEIPFDPVKSAIGLFIAELLSKSLREEEANQELFEFLQNSILYFDVANKGVANFHLYFLVQLSRYLGFYPSKRTKDEPSWFDLRSGSFLSWKPDHGECFNQDLSESLHQFQQCTIEDLNTIRLNRDQRFGLVKGLIHYFEYHFDGFPGMKSHEVLKDLFDS